MKDAVFERINRSASKDPSSMSLEEARRNTISILDVLTLSMPLALDGFGGD